jgi:dTDP-4-amino-4,6-dideoxygalactose transaminase
VSGNYILGPNVEKFENNLARFLGVENAIAVASGTDALLIALRTLGIGHGDLVATVPNAGGYATTAIRQVGASPVFIDCMPNGQMSANDLARALSEFPAINAVVMTHLYGLIGEVEQVTKICGDLGVFLLEDCAQAVGARTANGAAGSFGDISTFSFYPTKNLAALGDSGAVATNDKSLAERVKSLRQYGWSSRYEVTERMGTNSRMDEFQASVLNRRILEVDDLNQRRRQVWSLFSEALSGDLELRMIGEDSGRFAAHLGILLTPAGTRSQIQELFESKGIATGVHYPILDYDQKGFEVSSHRLCPVAEDLTQRIISVPLFPTLTDQEIVEICQALKVIGASHAS